MRLKYTNPDIEEGINTTQTNPLKEFAFLISVVLGVIVVVTILLTFLFDYTAEYIPFEYEASISRPVVENINAETSEVDQYLQKLADTISPHLSLPESMKITVHYVDNDMVNAMATLGGHIIVYRGLLEKLPNENALMMLLGHEISHIKLRHPIKALGKGVIMSLLMVSILGDSSNWVSGILSDTSQLMMLSFNRDQEQQADEDAMRALNSYYGHVDGATDLFKMFKQQTKNNAIELPQFLNSHPDLDNRIANLNAMAEANHWYLQGAVSAIPEQIICNVLEKC